MESRGHHRAFADDAVLNYEEAARYLGTSRRHLERLVEERRITHRKIGRFVRFRRSDLELFLATARVPAAPWRQP